MINPFRFRPTTPEADVDHDGEVADWEDNSLSNALAWASVTFTPAWCQNEQHWSARFANYLFTSCPCCMFYRGCVIGLLLAIPLWLVILTALLLAFGAL